MADLQLLRDVSRSFFLSIRLLPPALREPVALGYLLARATDTVADTAAVPAADRLEHLQALARAIESGDAGAVARLGEAFAPHQADGAERRLILALPACLAWLARLEPADRHEVLGVLRPITRGQALDLERFPGVGLRALQTPAELDQYTYLVAGCVGEFWSRLCVRHVPGFSHLPEERLCELGRGFGMGLQLVNILRDAAEDLAAGRCYFPASQLAAAGLSPADVQARPEAFRPVWDHWQAIARQRLQLGLDYALAVEHRRIRAAGALPALLGVRTLALLQSAGPPPPARRVKVARPELRRMGLRLAFTLAGRGALAAQFARLSRMPQLSQWDNRGT